MWLDTEGERSALGQARPHEPAPSTRTCSRGRRSLRWVAGRLAAVGVLTAALIAAVPAHATFPGGNGRIAYTWSRGGEGFESGPHPRLVGVVSVRPDGRRPAAGRTRRHPSPLFARRTENRVPARRPACGPLGPTASGRGRSRRATGGSDNEWSPGGTRLALVRSSRNHTWDALYTVRPDGSGLQRLLKGPRGSVSPPARGLPTARQSSTPSTATAVGRWFGSSAPATSRHSPSAHADLVAPRSDRLRDAGTTSRPGQVCLIRPERVPLPLLRLCGRNRFRPHVVARRPPVDAHVHPSGRARGDLDRTPGRRGPDPGAPRQRVPDLLAGRTLARLQPRPVRGGPPPRLQRPLPEAPGWDAGRRLVRGGQAQAPDWQPLTPRRSAH